MTTKEYGYWRSLEELANTPDFRRFAESEFPSEWSEPVNRRKWLRVMASSFALAGLSSCMREPTERIVPYVRAPEDVVPGKPLFFATASTLGGFAKGVLVESHMGRPTKVEGNPQHPASLGGTDVFTQASVLALYDPDRSQVVTHAGRIGSWVALIAALNQARQEQLPRKGAGLRFLTGAITSPALADQIRTLLAEFPNARWYQHEPVGRENIYAGSQLAFGEAVAPIYRLDKADVIVALDADFLGWGPGSLRYTRDFTSRRRVDAMNRLYALESTPTITGSMADHRRHVRASEVEQFARGLAHQLGLAGVDNPGVPDTKFLDAVAADLRSHRGAGLVVAGDQQPPAVHALAHAINHELGNAGKSVYFVDPVEAPTAAPLADLVAEMNGGAVDLLVIVGCNPVFTAPADLRFADELNKVKMRVHLGLYEDETAYLCHWHVPEAHELETWSDARAFDGTTTIMQPLIAPLYEGKSAHELLAVLAGQGGMSSHDIVRQWWESQHTAADFADFWQTALHDGLVTGTAQPPKRVSPKPDLPARLPKYQEPPGGLEIVFRPDPTIWDGRFANNAWLQELPKPLTKLTWDNAALLSDTTARKLGVTSGDVVELGSGGRSARAPIWVLPGHADDSVTVHLGYGRTRAGRVGTSAGFNAYALRTSGTPWFANGLEIRKTGDRYPLVSTQHHFSMENRNLVRVATLAQFQKDPHFAREMEEQPAPDFTLYPGYAYRGYAWGMTIDLNACIGCGACVVACQAENNIPVVGKDEVSRGREMHWIRIDRYYEGDPDDPSIYHEPVPCMHCEDAPCELVCPVGATVHSDEGLNQMIYNRCVGTRYCSNNCPYKVRRFNFFQFADWKTPSLKAQRNPDVTVRSRGVMEKCTYCVQRINEAKIQAEEETRQVRDGEIVTACQAVCPARAIVFGNINDPDSQVARLKSDPRNYGLLTDLNTRPRTTYLARLRNPNPEIESGS
jgi:molybdopterin-containing oxidoreductase family iron-sulfur binding subunit